jgi:hypothetical protein
MYFFMGQKLSPFSRHPFGSKTWEETYKWKIKFLLLSWNQIPSLNFIAVLVLISSIFSNVLLPRHDGFLRWLADLENVLEARL